MQFCRVCWNLISQFLSSYNVIYTLISSLSQNLNNFKTGEIKYFIYEPLDFL